MNHRGESSENLLGTYVVYFVLVVLFFAMVFYYVSAAGSGAKVWEDFYAKEVALMIDSAKKDSEIWIDVSEATRIAQRNGVAFNEIFSFDNVNNRVMAHLAPSSSTSYGFFGDLDVTDWRVEQVSGEYETNRLYFRLVEAERDE